MKRFLAVAVAVVLPFASAAGAQENRAGVFPPNEVDQIKVDKAIEAGVAALKRNNGAYLTMSEHAGTQVSRCELVLYTYINSGVPEADPAFKQLFDDMMKRRMEATYCVALQAMVLEDLERAKYQRRIQMCAQFLVDNQNPEGMWGYGSPSIFVEEIPTEAPRKDVSSGGGGTAKVRSFDKLPPPGVKVKPTVKNKLKVEKKRDGTGNDNSNSQYAALGMRACHDSGIVIPAAVTDKALEWWRKSQKTEKSAPEDFIEGGVYGPEVKKGGTVASSITKKAEPNGWCYSNHGEHKAYGSMTAGATGSLAIYMYIKDNDEGKKRSWKNDKDIHEGLVWLSKNFSVTYNPGPYEHGGDENSQKQYYYYLYGLERAGMLYGTEVMGTHKWYPEGVKVLLANQKPDGTWGDSDDTCFAILFLKRATKSLDVATGGGK